MKTYFIEQADYQRWASAELFNSLDTLSDEQRRAHLGLFFQDIHHTVDHILMVTRNWQARLQGKFEQTATYDALLYTDWAELKTALLNEFAELGTWLNTQPPQWFNTTIEYPGSDGKTRRTSVRDSLIHLMTHAVHHRGQVSAACTRLNAPSPKMDFVFYLRRNEK